MNIIVGIFVALHVLAFAAAWWLGRNVGAPIVRRKGVKNA